jgi:hypothetical protein
VTSRNEVTCFILLINSKMMIFLNAQERTVQDFVDMCHETGWEVEEIHRGMPGIHSQIVLALLK